MRSRAICIIPQENYTLLIEFYNGEKEVFDVKLYFKHKTFKELKNIDKFKIVKIDGLSIKWTNGADICPNKLYNLSKKI